VTHPLRGPQKVAVVKTNRVNYITMEDIPAGEQVLAGTFSLNRYPAIVLFDSGATHDFMHTPLNLAGKLYKPSLIVLDGQGLDIILGMGWMRAHKALHDIAARVVHLDSPIYDVHALQLSSSFVATPSVHHTVAQSLEDISMACEFPDVFLEDLPSMPPDRDVEFTIEL
jgi:hypothetical protein